MTTRTTQILRTASSAATVLAAVAAVFLCVLPAPAGALDGGDFACLVRETQKRADQRITAMELLANPRRYAYYTQGYSWHYTGASGWAAAYHPGALWSFYQLSGDTWWRDRAVTRQAAIGRVRLSSSSPNIGALYFPSFVRGYRLTGDRALRTSALKAAASMVKLYDPVVGAMLSRPNEEFNVIIDSLMKPQFLWWAAENGGPKRYAKIARAHALTIARDFVRADGSTCHICYYDEVTGALVRRGRGSAYSADSTWARGQAWAILGFAAAYRETGDAKLLDAARAVTDWYLDNVPADMVPYWDFGAPDIPSAPRDSSAAAIAASGLLDLAVVDPDAERRERYEAAARDTLAALMSSSYSSFDDRPTVLVHGTYSWHLGITDCGLAFGDAFFLEALLRLRRLTPEGTALAIASSRASAGSASAAVDGDLKTCWSSKKSQTLDVRLTRTREVGAVRLALTRGDSRAARLRIYVSSNGTSWRRVLQTMTSGETSGYETLDFEPRSARWVRVACNGTTSGSLNRIAEIEVYSEP